MIIPFSMDLFDVFHCRSLMRGDLIEMCLAMKFPKSMSS